MKIHAKKFLLALGLSFLAIVIFDILLHAIILRDVWSASKEYWLPAEEMNKRVPLGWLSLLVTLIFSGLIYTQLKNKSLKQGFLFGLFIGIAGFCGAIGLISIVPWPVGIVIGMAVQQLFDNLILGLIFGRLYYED